MERKDIRNTLGDADLGYLDGDVADGDLGRGYYDAGPRGNYEGSLDPTVTHWLTEDGIERREGGTLHPGQIEPDGYYPTHGDLDQYGFVRRPRGRTDVEHH